MCHRADGVVIMIKFNEFNYTMSELLKQDMLIRKVVVNGFFSTFAQNAPYMDEANTTIKFLKISALSSPIAVKTHNCGAFCDVRAIECGLEVRNPFSEHAYLVMTEARGI